MQPGYGIPELQQFMTDGSSLFTLSNDLNPPSQQKSGHQNLQLQLQQQHQQQTRGYQYHHFQPFLEFPTLQQPRWLHQQTPPPPPSLLPPHSPPPPQQPHLLLEADQGNPSSRLLPFISNFKPVVNINETSCSREMHRFPDEEASLLRDEPSSGRRWQEEEGGDIKSPNEPMRGPFWVSDLAFNGSRPSTSGTAKRYRKAVEESEPPAAEVTEGKSSNAGYGKFGELEAIYNVNFYGTVGGDQLQGGSGSALTGDNAPPAAGKPSLPREVEGTLASENFVEEEEEDASLRKAQKKRKKKKRQKQQMASIASFFEKLVNQLMEHQETLHKRFMEVMEKRDQERQNREEEWRRQEAARLSREKALRAQEEAAVSSREAAIVSFLEKITGETLVLPKRDTHVCSSSMPEPAQPENSETERRNEAGNGNRRWPKSEVNALIKVRSGLEARFQEPGLKGPLWEEVSAAMAAMGYCRSAKRCKEKWENINKYFRKTKNSTKRRSQRSKTCPYFQQLDLLYTNKAPASSAEEGAGVPSNSELVDAIAPLEGGRRKFEPGAVLDSSYMNVAETIDRDTINKDTVPLNCSDNENDEEEEDGDQDEEDEEDDGDRFAPERGGKTKLEDEEANLQCGGSFMELVHNLTGNSTSKNNGSVDHFSVCPSSSSPLS